MAAKLMRIEFSATTCSAVAYRRGLVYYDWRRNKEAHHAVLQNTPGWRIIRADGEPHGGYVDKMNHRPTTSDAHKSGPLGGLCWLEDQVNSPWASLFACGQQGGGHIMHEPA